MAERGRAGSLDVTEGVIWRQLLLLCVPVFFSSFFQEAYSLVNTFVVGQYAGKAALGGIQATAPLVDLAVGFSVGMGTGFAVVCSQYFGAHDEERLSASVHTAMTIALVGGLAVSVLGSLLAEPILSLMGTPADLMAESLAFVRTYFGAMVFSIVYNTGSAVQRSVGDTRSPSVIVASTCVVNIVLDLVFVAGMHMEAAGAGMATALSLAWGCALTLVRLTHVDGPWRLDLRRLRIDPGICRVMLRCGLPLGLQSSCYSVSNIITQATINSFGSTVVTAFGLCGRIDAIIWMASEALGVAVTTFSAQNFGARNYERMRRGLRCALCLTALVVGSLSVVLMANVLGIAGFFVRDPEIAALTAQVMWYIGPSYVVYSALRQHRRHHPRGRREPASHDHRAHGLVPAARGLAACRGAAQPHAAHGAAELPHHVGDHGRGVHPVLPPRALDGPREGAQGGQPGSLGEKTTPGPTPALLPWLSPRRAESARLRKSPGEKGGRRRSAAFSA